MLATYDKVALSSARVHTTSAVTVGMKEWKDFIKLPRHVAVKDRRTTSLSERPDMFVGAH